MGYTSKASLFLLLIGFVCQISGNFESGKPIQIIVPENNTFHLNINELKGILETDAIKNRNVSVISLAGAFRQGKSFLLNFFLRYLYARVSNN